MVAQPQELSFEVEGLTIAAQAWGNPNGQPILALHGWLDNAASFSRLAPLLNDHYLIALDLPGHGYSSHHPATGSYNLWDDLTVILAVLDLLDWPAPILMGHSRGAMMALLLVASCPSRFSRLILLDGLWPPPVKAEDAPKQLGKYLRDRRSVHRKKLPHYASREEAIAARCRASGMGEAAAEVIVNRGLIQDADGFRWSSDPRLTGASAFKLTEAHNRAMTEAVQIPTLLLLAEQGMGSDQSVAEKVAQFPQIECHTVSGGHHCHLEDSVEQLVPKIEDFLRR